MKFRLDAWSIFSRSPVISFGRGWTDIVDAIVISSRDRCRGRLHGEEIACFVERRSRNTSRVVHGQVLIIRDNVVNLIQLQGTLLRNMSNCVEAIADKLFRSRIDPIHTSGLTVVESHVWA